MYSSKHNDGNLKGDQATTRLAVIAPGAMGSAVARELVGRGAQVLTVIDSRSERSTLRARDAGMIAADLSDLPGCDLILSIVPPDAAIGLAQMLAPVLRQSPTKPAFIDFNAINPATMQDVSAALSGTGCDVLDGAIIGLPPQQGRDGPTFYISGDPDGRADVLASFGLKLRQIDGPVGAASALKMVYAGINKGLVALGTAMFLASERAGCAQALSQQMSESLPNLRGQSMHAIPDMYGKAYRWVPEMREITAFLGENDPASGIFDAASQIFASIAKDADRTLIAALDRVLSQTDSGDLAP
jgi:3-hydroxyisobutyrate dehydrogenase-like beta-hydroxyacid dehydrogenase